MKIESPCIRECLLEQGVCISCFRTREEIMKWAKFSDMQREEIMNDLALRRNQEKDVDSC